MEGMILSILVIVGIVLLLFSFKKSPVKDWFLVYLLTAYFSIFIGVIVVEENMLEYPVNILGTHFSSSLLYEYLLFPVINIYFYQTTYHSRYVGIILQSTLYASASTTIEVFLERYTNLIEYHTWTWIHTFISISLLMIFVRTILILINKKEKNESKRSQGTT